jgi:hypothetical protein
MILAACRDGIFSAATQEKSYSITVKAGDGGIIRSSDRTGATLKLAGAKDDKLQLTAIPNSGYAFAGWSIASGSGRLDANSEATTTYIIGDADASVTASFVKAIGGGTVGVGGTISDVNLTIAGPMGVTTAGTADYSYQAIVNGASVAGEITRVTWRLDGITAATGDAAGVYYGTALGAGPSGTMASNCGLTLIGMQLAVGSYRIDCEIEYRGHVYSASRDVSCLSTTPGTLKWQSGSLGGSGIAMTPAIGLDGTAYFSAYVSGIGYRVYARWAIDGTPKWDFAPSANITAPPTVGKDGRIYLATSNGLDVIRDNGTAASRLGAPALGAYPPLNYLPAIGPSGWIYGTTSSRYLCAYTNAPSVAWAADYGAGYSLTTPATIGSDGTLYVALLAGGTALINALTPGYTPSGKWSFGISSANIYSPIAYWSADASLYFANTGMSKTLYAIIDSATSSSNKWNHPLPDADELASAPIIGPTGTVYMVYRLTAGGVRLSAFDGSSGNIAWSYDLAGSAHGSPAVASDGTVYFCAGTVGSSALYAVRDFGASATPLWNYPVTQNVGNSSVAIGPDGTVYFGTEDGTLYAVYGSAAPSAAGWPMLGKNARRSGYAGDAQ